MFAAGSQDEEVATAAMSLKQQSGQLDGSVFRKIRTLIFFFFLLDLFTFIIKGQCTVQT